MEIYWWIIITIWILIGVGFAFKMIEGESRKTMEDEPFGVLLSILVVVVFWPSILIACLIEKFLK